MIVSALIERLDAVKQTGEGRWIARCPSHDDKTPSLSIRETSDGTILLKCWAQCGVSEIVASIGMELRDLFPRNTDYRQPLKPRERWHPRDLLQILRREATVILIAARDIAGSGLLSDADQERLLEAVIRISTVTAEVAS